MSEPFTSYPNIVFAPHVYTYAFTVEQDLIGMPARPGGYPPNFTFGYQTAEAEAQAIHAAVFVTEFGDSSSTDGTILANELSAQEATQTGATVWAWKGLAKAPGYLLVRALAALELPDDVERDGGQGQSEVGPLAAGPAHPEPPAPAHAGLAGGHGRALGRLRVRPHLGHASP